MSEADDGGPKRFRSPPYPAIDLAKAIERAGTLYGKALHHQVSSNVLADAWKYGAKSSGLWATAAALIQYGLLIDQGSGPARRFQLTDAAIRIVKDADPASEKRREAVQRAALRPPIFRELWADYGGAEISDVILQNHLTLDRREAGKSAYSHEAAADIIRGFKATIGYAGLLDSGSVPRADEGKDDGAPEDVSRENTLEIALVPKWKTPPPKDPPADQQRGIVMMAGERELTSGLLSKGANFRLIVSGQIGVKEIERLISKLEIDKDILAEADKDDVEDLV